MKYKIGSRSESRMRWGFSLIELMIALATISVLGIGLSKYIKQSQKAMRDSLPMSSASGTSTLIKKRLAQDLQEVAFLRPSCEEKPAPSVDVDRPCADIKVQSGFMIYPGASKTTMTSLTSLSQPDNLEADASSLDFESDAIRIALFDYNDSFNCSLKKGGTVNPSVEDEVGSGEILRAGPECEGLIQEGQVYAIVEMFDLDPYSPSADDLSPYANVFQVTDLEVEEDVEVRITALSTNNLFNQPGGLGLSGFSEYARIYPIKFVEWAVHDGSSGQSAGLYRRELSPTAGQLSSFGEWTLIEPTIEAIQFYPATISVGSFTQHNRTMAFDATDSFNDGMEDIRGVGIRMIVKSSTPTSDATTYDNPLTAAVEADQYPRSDSSFFIDFRNAEVMN